METPIATSEVLLYEAVYSTTSHEVQGKLKYTPLQKAISTTMLPRRACSSHGEDSEMLTKCYLENSRLRDHM
jgi:hypothetical protein